MSPAGTGELAAVVVSVRAVSAGVLGVGESGEAIGGVVGESVVGERGRAAAMPQNLQPAGGIVIEVALADEFCPDEVLIASDRAKPAVEQVAEVDALVGHGVAARHIGLRDARHAIERIERVKIFEVVGGADLGRQLSAIAIRVGNLRKHPSSACRLNNSQVPVISPKVGSCWRPVVISAGRCLNGKHVPFEFLAFFKKEMAAEMLHGSDTVLLVFGRLPLVGW